MKNKRRDFIKQAAAGAAVVSFGGILPGFSAKSYGNIMGANERINVAAMGVNSRGMAVSGNFARQDNCEVMYVCDVDSRAADKCIAALEPIQKKRPKAAGDFRKALEDKDLDALIVTAPDHWHAPAAILACKAGKHVYLEKPCSHNPNEGELVVEAARKYNRVIQMGNQRRSWPNVVAAIKEIHDGTIGRAKLHLEETAKDMNAAFGRGTAVVSVNKALVTQASSAIPVVPLYISILYKIMKAKGIHEGCIEQIHRLFAERFGVEGGPQLDEKGRIRIDDWEMRPEVQEEVNRVWDKVTTATIDDVADFEGYQKEFYRLFGFGLEGVDYAADSDPVRPLPSQA